MGPSFGIPGYGVVVCQQPRHSIKPGSEFISRTRYRICECEYPYFLTDTIIAWLPVFSHPELVDIIFDSLRFLQRERKVLILGYVIMENHLHWIASGQELAKNVGQFKSYTARRIIERMEACGYETLLQESHFFNGSSNTALT